MLDAIKSIPIEQVVGSSVALKRTGARSIGLCPFHGENSPSFTVYHDTNTWHCFGCSKGGSSIDFIMERDSISAKEAIKILGGGEGAATAPESDTGEALVKAWARYLAPARPYLASRGVSDADISKFEIGFSPTGKPVFHGLDRAELDDLGVVKSNGSSRFDGMLILPIRDVNGTVIGFGARQISDKKPKYVNSGNCKRFQKSKALYGIYQARRSIKESGRAIVTEGYFDVISLHRSGSTNAVAVMGSSFSQNHLELLRAIGMKELVFAFDGDAAGEEASMKAIKVASHAGVASSVIDWGAGEDPDSYLRGGRSIPKGIAASEWAAARTGALPSASDVVPALSSEVVPRPSINSWEDALMCVISEGGRPSEITHRWIKSADFDQFHLSPTNRPKFSEWISMRDDGARESVGRERLVIRALEGIMAARATEDLCAIERARKAAPSIGSSLDILGGGVELMLLI